MRVWMVNHYAIPPSVGGGTRHYSLARQLIKRGHEVVIIAAGFAHLTHTNTLRADETWNVEQIDGVTFVRIRVPPYERNGLARIWNTLVFSGRAYTHQWQSSVARPDVIIGSSPHLFAALSAQRLAAHFAVPFVLEVRDLWPQSLVDLANLPARHPAVRLMECLERYLYSRSAAIIALMPEAGGHIESKGISPGKISYVPNGVDFDLSPEPMPYPNGPQFVIMYAGAHGQANGLDVVLDAARVLIDDGWELRVRFRLIGEGPEKERLKRRAATEGLSCVSFEDAVPKNRVYGVLGQANAFIMVLKPAAVFQRGISPNKLYDYFACGRPVIYAVNAANNPVQEAGAGVSASPEDPIALAATIKRLAETPRDELEMMGKRGLDYVRRHHSMQSAATTLESVLLQAVNQRGAAS